KVVGAMLLDDEQLPLSSHALVVSGRTSFEIVQKAWIAGVGLVCAVSAPSTLAIDLADEAGITLLGFARDGGVNVYSHPERIDLGRNRAGYLRRPSSSSWGMHLGGGVPPQHVLDRYERAPFTDRPASLGATVVTSIPRSADEGHQLGRRRASAK